jgi:hypothetical protein
MDLRRESALVQNGLATEPGDVIVVSLSIAPLVMAAAAVIERRLGPSAAGWVAALPIAFAVAVLAVSFDAGARTAGAMALSAATHVPAQIVFGVVFACVLVRRGLLLGAAAGILAYAGTSLCLADTPVALVVAGAIPMLALAPRLMSDGRPHPASPRRWPTTALTCVIAMLIVGAAVVTIRIAGPELAGAVAAFPSVSTTLAVAVVTRDGPAAGGFSLTGLVRSLPCYLTFCLVFAGVAPATGLGAVALGLVACLVTAGATWRRVPLTRGPGDEPIRNREARSSSRA